MFLLLFFSTLPLFGLVLIGYSAGKFSFLDRSDAKVLLRLVAIIIVPFFGIKIIGNFRYEFINWSLYWAYFFAQSIIYLSGFSLAKIMFKRNNDEAIIIGMTSAFSNHLFFVYPIALFEFGAKEIVPIETIIAADFVTVALSVCALDITSQKNFDVKGVLIKQIYNPALIGLFLGLLVQLSNLNLPQVFQRLVDFVCNAGTPVALIAMGILLSFGTNKTQVALSILIALLKIVTFPIILLLLLFYFNFDMSISTTTLMVSAAPIGAMGLVFAAIYNITTDAVVRSGVITYILALISIPLVGIIC